MKPIRVLVVDDSATMRGIIANVVRQDPQLQVVGMAGDPYEAREAIKKLNPDVLTLDIEMPQMTGIEFLEKIMRLRPMPVIMVSTLTRAGGVMAVEALARGAFDCVDKTASEDCPKGIGNLPAIIKAAAASPVARRASKSEPSAPPVADNFRPNRRIVAIGASTGGVDALMVLLKGFPANCPPTVVTQHIQARFTTSLAARLNQNCLPTVTEATNGAILKPGTVYLAPGGEQHLEVLKGACLLRDGPPISGHRPSVDALFHSVAKLGSRSLGVILTGMGRDGAEGMAAIRAAGGRTIGQDRASSVVYGMPRVAHECGGVERQLPLSQISGAILELCDAAVPAGAVA